MMGSIPCIFNQYPIYADRAPKVKNMEAQGGVGPKKKTAIIVKDAAGWKSGVQWCGGGVQAHGWQADAQGSWNGIEY